ncbi:FMN-binding protein [Anaerocolumna sp. MB42-C2]|uniref:FMN-binding protein n=1 Tax=Anaerocolumna sp. MB42-C2 TaxID=3070997 RepID=UPI0027E19A88|nr:FMN-binding protein [Anaerocolumna sp. MB42-C2]WMJ89027.1 FMN-binding protein [Anaerocolumna sp. MB42-C2]
MKKKIVILVGMVLTVTLAILIFTLVIPEMNYEKVRNMEINNVDLEKVNDGTYNGKYTYGHYTYQVEVTVKNHEIKSIDVINGRVSEHAKAAEGVLDNILTEQKIDVDVVSGATTTSKALLKAVENALRE